MLMVIEEKRISKRVQLTFDFVSPDEVKKPARRRTKKPDPVKKSSTQRPITEVIDGEQQRRITDVCLLLHDLARKFVPVTEFRDHTTLSRCTKVLREEGAITELPLELSAVITDHEAALVTHAPQYRLLRNRAIAGLATVADLGTKAPAKGSPEYQRGMRDAYQHASDIAAMFLEDLQEGV